MNINLERWPRYKAKPRNQVLYLYKDTDKKLVQKIVLLLQLHFKRKEDKNAELLK